MKTTSNKDAVLTLIRANPAISQQELAAQLDISRSAVAGHIAGLIKEGQILGRAYVLPQKKPVLCIGGANIDRKLRILGQFQMGTSNPVSQQESMGGVARNIAENLARLGTPVALMTAVGDDAAGEQILAHCQHLGIDASPSVRFSGAGSGSYTAVLGEQGEMLLALAHMTLCDELAPELLQQRRMQRQSAAMVIADMNLPASGLADLMQEAQQLERPLVVVGVSAPKMARLPACLDGISLLILNRDELEARVGKALPSTADLARACAVLQQQGAAKLIVTLGSEGVFYTDTMSDKGGHMLRAGQVSVVDVTGAGDAFTAGVCWSLLQAPDDTGLACQRGLRLAELTLQTGATVAESLHPGFFNEE